MPRRRWVSLALILALVAAGAGYHMAQGDTGPVLRTVTVGNTPLLVAVDERTNRAFVTNSADQSQTSREAPMSFPMPLLPPVPSPNVSSQSTPSSKLVVSSAGRMKDSKCFPSRLAVKVRIWHARPPVMVKCERGYACRQRYGSRWARRNRRA
jgi:hypothetical protein